MEFELKNDILFENNQSINSDTIEFTLRNYLERGSELFSSDNKSLWFSIGKLKNAIHYYTSAKPSQDKRLTCFQKIDNYKFKIFFEPDYIKDNSLFEIIQSLNYILLFPLNIKLYDYGSPANPIISYGDYKIEEYDLEQGLLLKKNVNSLQKIIYIYYQIITSFEQQLNLFKSNQLNELETNESIIKDNNFQEYISVSNNKVISLIINLGDRHDASFRQNKEIYKKVPSILRDDDFKRALFCITGDIIKSLTNVEPQIFDKVKVDKVQEQSQINIMNLLNDSYSKWKFNNPNEKNISLDLVYYTQNLLQQEIAEQLKNKIENLKIDNNFIFSVNLIPVNISPHAGDISLAEFQKVYDLIITHISLPINKFDDYVNILEKINIDDKITFSLSFRDINNEQINELKNILELQETDLEQIKIDQLKHIYQKVQEKANNPQKQLFLDSLIKTMEQKIKEQKALYPLYEDKKFIAFKNIKSSKLDFCPFLDIIKTNYFDLNK